MRERTDTVVIGGGQAGLVMSYLLAQPLRIAVDLDAAAITGRRSAAAPGGGPTARVATPRGPSPAPQRDR